ncbi:MAG: tRNA (N6-isopentenyl adenosine(37)-C2)-methylthiotransferase MiaB [Treponema sp.]|nr:tRNA (N6-isopentenyl adenosine(37)-C2)-methylthiotransferase MiaB [Treponema sp.]
MTYFFETYGCQMNIAESASIEQLFIARGWKKAEDAQIADMVIINTCSVRQTAENRILGRLGWYSGLKAVRQKQPGAKAKTLELAQDYVKNEAKPLTLVVTGCMAERLLDSLKKEYPCIDYVVGTYAKKHFGEIIEAVEEGHKTCHPDNSEKYQFAPLSYEPGAFTAFVPIMHGCNNFCTYCIVPYVRGRELSRPVDEILKEIDILSGYGVREITLLGQNVNSYNSDGNNFASLLKKIADRIKETKSSIGWVRFMSSHPKDLSDDVIKVISEEEVLCHHIHLPVQHGSTKILKQMNRRYTRDDYIALIEKIRKAIPDVSLTTDLMMGFPGETEEDVLDTLNLMKTINYENAFMYYYNVREGTPAATYPNQIPTEVKKERLQRVIDLQLQITIEQMEKRVGQTVKVLCENISRDSEDELLGKTQQDERVAFKADKKLIGTFATVKIEALNGNTFRGVLV